MRTNSLAYRIRSAWCWLDRHFEACAAVAIPVIVLLITWIEICWR
jgi:hypothetical protein